jgi:putative membrane protein
MRLKFGLQRNVAQSNQSEHTVPQLSYRFASPSLIEFLPHINVSLNALATLLLLVGLVLIKRKQELAHRRVMLATFGVSVVFLISYLTYHANADSKHFPTDPQVASTQVRYLYYAILLSHIVLAAIVPLLAIGSIYLGLTGQRALHRRLSVITWPVWFYVSITGILVYLMLYQWYAPVGVATAWTAAQHAAKQAFCRLLLCGVCIVSLSTTCWGQDITAQAPAQLATAAERLTIAQTGELIEAGEINEALRLLEKLLDEAEDRMVATTGPQHAATLTTQRYIPLAQWSGQRTVALLQQFPDTAAKVLARQREPATLALEQLQETKDLRATQLAARRFLATELGGQFQLFMSDLYLERGWGIAASQAVESIRGETRVGANSPPGEPPVFGSLAAPLVWQQLAAGRTAAEQERLWQALFASPSLRSSDAPPSSDRSQTSPDPGLVGSQAAVDLNDIVLRLVIAATMNSESLDAPATRAWGFEVARHSNAAAGEKLKSAIEQIAAWPPLATRPTTVDSFHWPPVGQDAGTEDAVASAPGDRDATDPVHRAYVSWPTWSQPLERFSASSDRLAASKPRVAESERATLPYFPVVDKGIVFVNEMTRIVAYDLETGAPWPDAKTGLSLFDSELSAASYLPLGYPMIGSPRGTLHIANHCLYARMGSPITGRIQSRSPGGAGGDTSLSYLVGLDLSKQGSMLPGFPLHLSNADLSNVDFDGAEFDGPPLAWGDMLIVAVAQRDHVGLRRSIAAFDRVTGKLLWKSGVLGSGSVTGGEHANLIAHQQLTLAGGRLYTNTNLGAIACLDPTTGQVQWLVQYSTPHDNPSFPKPDRYRYRDLTPCLVSAGLVYCAPQDTPEIFALDALTGELVWSTDDLSVADANQLLGAPGDALIVGGDRLVWLDKRTGRVAATFPGSTTPIVGGALPNPRGLGRGTISGQHVYWPTAGEIYVFSAQLPGADAVGDTPTIVRRIEVAPGGGNGVNVLIVGETLLVASPSRLMAYRAD